MEGSSEQVLVCRIVCDEPPEKGKERVCEEIEERIAGVSPSWGKNRGNGNLGPVRVEWISKDQLVVREESGKMRDIIEERVRE